MAGMKGVCLHRKSKSISLVPVDICCLSVGKTETCLTRRKAMQGPVFVARALHCDLGQQRGGVRPGEENRTEF